MFLIRYDIDSTYINPIYVSRIPGALGGRVSLKGGNILTLWGCCPQHYKFTYWKLVNTSLETVS